MLTAPSRLRSATPAVPVPSALHGPVLLATEGRAAGDSTARMARIVADRIGRDLRVVAVRQPLSAASVGCDAPTPVPEVESGRIGGLRTAIAHRLEPILGTRHRWHLDLRYGDPGHLVPEAAHGYDASLIVLGTGGHDVMDHRPWSALPRELMRAAEVPVLALAPEATGTLRRAVVGIDFSAASVRAARTALALLEPDAGAPTPLDDGEDARRVLTLVHVRSAARRPPSGAVDRDAGSDADLRARFARLCDLLRPLAPRGVKIETRLRTGGVWERLADTVRQTDAQLVAVGTHGPGRIEGPVVGSVAADALRQMPTSVLVTPPPDATECMQLERYIAGQLTLDEPEDWKRALEASRPTARRSGSARPTALPT